MILKTTFSTFLLLILFNSGYAQCNNETLFPSTVVQAPYYKTETIIANNQWAGEYALITAFNFGQTYQITSSEGNSDYISVYNLDDEPVAYGVSPLTISNFSFSDTLKVNFNLVSPPCGIENVSRITIISCETCPNAENVAIGNSEPHESAVLDLTNSMNQGVLLPKIDPQTPGPVPSDGLLGFDKFDDRLIYYDGNSYQTVKTLSDTKLITKIIPGAAFVPIEDCVHRFSNAIGKYSDGTKLIAPLELPIGAKLNHIKYYYYDSSSNSADIRFFYQPIEGTGPSVTNYIYNTQGAVTGIRSYEFNSIGFLITSANAYYFQFNPGSTTLDSGLAIKAVEVVYEY